MAHEKHLARTIDGALIHLLDQHNKINVSPSDYFQKYVRVLLPYAITPFSTTGRMFMVNREYKPLGIGDFNEWVDYTGYQCCLLPKTYEQLRELPLVDGLKNAAGLFFYQDATSPWLNQTLMDSYQHTLTQLLSILKRNIDSPATKQTTETGDSNISTASSAHPP